MKKRLSLLLLAGILMMTCLMPALARDIDLVTDAAQCLTEDEYLKLNELATTIADKHQCDVYAVTINEATDGDIYEIAKQIYEQKKLGYGEDKSGLLLLLNLNSRDYSLIAHGYGNTVFTDHGKDVMMEKHVLPLLKDNKYYDAFNTYLTTADEYLTMAKDGKPFDKDTDPDKARGRLWINLAVVLLLPMLIASGLCYMWYTQMKTAVIASSADDYIPEEGFDLTHKEDQFLYQTVTRRKIEKSNGTTVDSSGFSGKSGKF